ncbi:unnamed protein product [Danaus chrysippus]|uniref:(African queen) hypothetical protein n=1 Tax=Danaus chrysippus TaxID=151541 RepID=A0A8J2QCB7_9NEOP|nr:unnamed protein product [Danaus chrysippus]
MSFNGKVVIVTGASSGIGAAVAKEFSSEGAQVVMVGRNEAKLSAVAAECDKPLVIRADVANDDDARRIIDETIKQFGKLDILVNNAGVVVPESILNLNVLKAYDATMGINLRAVIHLTSLAASHLIKTKGSIINVSSVGGQMVPRPNSGFSMYYVSKAALNHLGLCIASELAPYGVRVNTISPGPVRTNIFDDLNIDVDNFCNSTALQRVSEPKEVADLILFLSSDKAKGITGSNYVIDNGIIICRSMK